MPKWAKNGQRYWALVVQDNSPFPTVYGSYHGAAVDPARYIPGERHRTVASVFTTQDRAQGYLDSLPHDAAAKNCTVREVVWVRDGVVRYPHQVTV